MKLREWCESIVQNTMGDEEIHQLAKDTLVVLDGFESSREVIKQQDRMIKHLKDQNIGLYKSYLTAQNQLDETIEKLDKLKDMLP